MIVILSTNYYIKFLFSFILISNFSFAQQERKVFLYNLGFGGLTSGIGAIINKPKTSDWKKYFIKGLWQGSIGGVLNYSGKKTIYLINKNESLVYGWPAKLLHHAGTSIIENASLNEPFLQNWNLDFGPVRFDFSFGNEKKLRVRFLPSSIYSIIDGFNEGRFSLSTTLLTGNLSFKRATYFPDGSFGYSTGRGITYIDYYYKYHSIAHELIHQFQFNEYQVFNAWFKPLIPKLKSENIKRAFEKYIYFDLPYFLPAYALEGQSYGPKYYRNFFEFEAERFATNSHVQIY
jgi:hypothetical protein